MSIFKKVKVKPILNKSNGQINFSLPKRKFSKKQFTDILKSKSMTIKIEKLYPELKGGLCKNG